MKKIAILIGSESDFHVAEKGISVLKKLGLEFEIDIISAHRTPEKARLFALEAANKNFGAIIAIAGKAAHLAGVIAAHTRLPVIGVPVKSDDLGGLDALLSTVQMPAGVPVATVTINGGANAAWLAARILALHDRDLAEKLEHETKLMAGEVENKNLALQERLKNEL